MEYGLGRRPSPETPRAASLYPVTRRADYAATAATWRYWWQGGAWLDQLSEGTCVGHAFAHRRADSPVPTGEITHEWARQLYFDASGDSTYQQGTSGYAACRVLADRGLISEYHWMTSPTELRNTLLTMGSVCVGIDWYTSMFTPFSQYSNKYLKVDKASGLAGGHEVLINGLNLAPSGGKPFYRMKNSWGTSWGQNGTVRILTSDLDDLLFNQNGDAVIIKEN